METANLMTMIWWAASGTGFTFMMTALGAASVFFFRKTISENVHRMALGLAAGIMIAASVWSLLIPAMEAAEEAGGAGWLPACGGFILGVAFLLLLDELLPHLHPGSQNPEGPQSHLSRASLLFFAVTLHNIPEGMSVGLLFVVAGQTGDPLALSAAFALALGMGIQNIPEGAAVSLPLRQEGYSAKKAFAFGALSGLAEPVFGVLVVLCASWITPFMPWLLAFSAGAMMYVVVEELIPEVHLGEHSNIGTLSVMSGFVLMMLLDCALG